MRDLEGWEHDWLLFQRNHQEKYGKVRLTFVCAVCCIKHVKQQQQQHCPNTTRWLFQQYPDEFVDMLKAAAAKGDDGVVDDDGEQVVQKTTARTADGEFGRFYNLEEDDTEVHSHTRGLLFTTLHSNTLCNFAQTGAECWRRLGAPAPCHCSWYGDRAPCQLFSSRTP